VRSESLGKSVLQLLVQTLRLLILAIGRLNRCFGARHLIHQVTFSLRFIRRRENVGFLEKMLVGFNEST
jgi:hypothetical protein